MKEICGGRSQKKGCSIEEKIKEIYHYQTDADKVEKKLTDLEDHSRKKNLQIDGVAEENGDS